LKISIILHSIALITLSVMPGYSQDISQSTIPTYSYRVINIYPHDEDAFTQGLVFEDGYLYEGTGRFGHSSLRKVDLESGTVLEIHKLPSEYFGEGITIFNNKIFQLTWLSYTGFVYDKENFLFLDNFYYSTEGWGITHDGNHFIFSDGTAALHFLNPETLEEVRQIEVRADNEPVLNLNELEYIKGEIFANVLPTDKIARIDPQTGKVTGWINLSGLLLGADQYDSQANILNGIAYDPEKGRLFVTGKFWPKLFEIEIIPSQ
jgi:glutamine cyclotransferase